MSGDEWVVSIFCLIISLVCWLTWFVPAFTISPLASSFRVRFWLLVSPLVCAGLLFFVLRHYASHDVRESATYLAFYMIMGSAWVGLAANCLPLFGLNPRDDVLERSNCAAAYAASGALIAFTLCFAGGNIGDGPGWWVVVFSALLSTGTLLVLWLCLAKFSGLAETISIERDEASGLRASGFLVATGLILGRAVAGHWEAARETAVDFVKLGWPALVLTAIAAAVEIAFRPNHFRPVRPACSHGLPFWILYVALAVWYVLSKGSPT